MSHDPVVLPVIGPAKITLDNCDASGVVSLVPNASNELLLVPVGAPGPAGAPGAPGSDADLAPHLAAADPHPQYALDADVTAAIAAHVAAADPHPQYALDTDVTAAIAAHVAAADPHPQYRLETQSKETLTANRTYYLNATSGNDSNDGLTSGTAWQTLQKVFDVLRTIDGAGFTVAVRLLNGTYPGPGIISNFVFDGTLTITNDGGSGNLANVKITRGSITRCFQFNLGRFSIGFSDITFESTSTQVGILFAVGNQQFYEFNRCHHTGPASSGTTTALFTVNSGAWVRLGTSFGIDPGTNLRRIANVGARGFLEVAAAVNASAAIAWVSEAFNVSSTGLVAVSVLPTGTFTGNRFVVATGGRVISSVNVAGFGSTDGTVAVGGYVDAPDLQTFSAPQKSYVDEMQLRTFTVATLPSATPAGRQIYVSDESGGAVPAFADGTNWRRVTDRAIVS